MIQITYRRSKCIGCSYCVGFAPQRWAMSMKDGKSILIGGVEKNGYQLVKVSLSEEDSIINASKSCPVKVIKIGAKK